MLGKRILTGIIGIAAAIGVIHIGGWALWASVMILAILAWQEFCRLFQNKQIEIPYKTGLVTIVMLLAAAFFGGMTGLSYVLPALVLAGICQMIFSDERLNPVRMSLFSTGVLYIGYLLAFLILLREISPQILATSFGAMEMGEAAVYWAFIGTWASDTFAFFVGSTCNKTIGTHKLCPQVSPGKSLEGAIGGLVGSMICMAYFGALFGFPVIDGIVLGFLVGIVAPLGDLCESSYKRYTGVKDSGTLLPGHGGILDRFDSILFVAPVVYLFINLFIL
ncbi:MAG: phosphatidate cytidylyltransferase [Selenomonadales bacterium]|nr:phosphatidate cytidylyltransferase [Selenomonadales bacterium]